MAVLVTWNALLTTKWDRPWARTPGNHQLQDLRKPTPHMITSKQIRPITTKEKFQQTQSSYLVLWSLVGTPKVHRDTLKKRKFINGNWDSSERAFYPKTSNMVYNLICEICHMLLCERDRNLQIRSLGTVAYKHIQSSVSNYMGFKPYPHELAWRTLKKSYVG